MIESSEDILDRIRTREVTGVFHSRKALIDAAEELLVAGIDRADIDVSASVDELDRRLNYQAIPAADLTDMTITPRQSSGFAADSPFSMTFTRGRFGSASLNSLIPPAGKSNDAFPSVN